MKINSKISFWNLKTQTLIFYGEIIKKVIENIEVKKSALMMIFYPPKTLILISINLYFQEKFNEGGVAL